MADRIKFIDIEGYTNDEKIKIGHNMKQKICKEYNINESDIIITNNVMKYIIKQVNENEDKIGKLEHGGVRGLESSLKHIFERLNILIDLYKENCFDCEHISYNIKNFKLPYEIKNEDVDMLLKNFMAKDNSSSCVRNMFI
jgi:ATP-dependent Lon protease